MEDKADRTEKMRKELGFVKDIENFENVAFHDEYTTLDKCIYQEIKVACKNLNAKSWNDCANAVKEALVGKKRPIMTIKNNQIKPLLENGQQVVRIVQSEDIDKLGQMCANILDIF